MSLAVDVDPLPLSTATGTTNTSAVGGPRDLPVATGMAAAVAAAALPSGDDFDDNDLHTTSGRLTFADIVDRDTFQRKFQQWTDVVFQPAMAKQRDGDENVYDDDKDWLWMIRDEMYRATTLRVSSRFTKQLGIPPEWILQTSMLRVFCKLLRHYHSQCHPETEYGHSTGEHNDSEFLALILESLESSLDLALVDDGDSFGQSPIPIIRRRGQPQESTVKPEQVPLLYWMLMAHRNRPYDFFRVFPEESATPQASLDVTSVLQLPSELQQATARAEDSRAGKRSRKRRKLMLWLEDDGFSSARNGHSESSKDGSSASAWQVSLIYILAQLVVDVVQPTSLAALYEWVFELSNYFPVIDSHHRETAFTCFQIDLLLQQAAAVSASASSGSQIVAWEDLTVDHVLTELSTCTWSRIRTFAEVANVPLDTAMALICRKFIAHKPIIGDEAVLLVCHKLFTLTGVTNRLPLGESRERIRPGARNGSLAVYREEQNTQVSVETPPGSKRRRTGVAEDGEVKGEEPPPIRKALLHPLFRLLVGLQIELLEDRLTQASIFASKAEGADFLSDDDKFCMFRQIFDYLWRTGKVFDDGTTIVTSLASTFVPYVGDIGMEMIQDLYRNFEAIISASTKVAPAEKTYVNTGCRQTLLKLLVVRYNENEGIRMFGENFDVPPGSHAANVRWAKELIEQQNPIPPSLQRIDGSPLPDLEDLVLRAVSEPTTEGSLLGPSTEEPEDSTTEEHGLAIADAGDTVDSPTKVRHESGPGTGGQDNPVSLDTSSEEEASDMEGVEVESRSSLPVRQGDSATETEDEDASQAEDLTEIVDNQSSRKKLAERPVAQGIARSPGKAESSPDQVDPGYEPEPEPDYTEEEDDRPGEVTTLRENSSQEETEPLTVTKEMPMVGAPTDGSEEINVPPASTMVDEGYDAEDSQGHNTEEEDWKKPLLFKKKVRSSKDEPVYDAEESSQGHTEDEEAEVSEAFQSEAEREAVEMARNARRRSDGGLDETKVDGDSEHLGVRANTLSDMSAADERTESSGGEGMHFPQDPVPKTTAGGTGKTSLLDFAAAAQEAAQEEGLGNSMREDAPSSPGGTDMSIAGSQSRGASIESIGSGDERVTKIVEKIVVDPLPDSIPQKAVDTSAASSQADLVEKPDSGKKSKSKAEIRKEDCSPADSHPLLTNPTNESPRSAPADTGISEVRVLGSTGKMSSMASSGGSSVGRRRKSSRRNRLNSPQGRLSFDSDDEDDQSGRVAEAEGIEPPDHSTLPSIAEDQQLASTANTNSIPEADASRPDLEEDVATDNDTTAEKPSVRSTRSSDRRSKKDDDNVATQGKNSARSTRSSSKKKSPETALVEPQPSPRTTRKNRRGRKAVEETPATKGEFSDEDDKATVKKTSVGTRGSKAKKEVTQKKPQPRGSKHKDDEAEAEQASAEARVSKAKKEATPKKPQPRGRGSKAKKEATPKKPPTHKKAPTRGNKRAAKDISKAEESTTDEPKQGRSRHPKAKSTTPKTTAATPKKAIEEEPPKAAESNRRQTRSRASASPGSSVGTRQSARLRAKNKGP